MTEAGCETEGERQGVCDCGETVTEPVAALGHEYSGTFTAENSDETEHWQVCSRCGARGSTEAHTWVLDEERSDSSGHAYRCEICQRTTETEAHSGPADGQYTETWLTHSWTCGDCGMTVTEDHTFDAEDTCTVCGFVSPVSGEQLVAPGVQANDSLDAGWFIHTLYFRLWVDTARIPDVEVEVEPGSGWTLLNGETSVNKGSITSADPYVIVAYGLVPDDSSQIKAGEKYTYTVVVRYNGEEIRRERWSFVFNEIADPITNSIITVTKEG